MKDLAVNLPTEQPPIVGSRKVAIVAGGTVLVLLSANALAGWWLHQYSPNSGYRRIRVMWSRLETLPRPVDTLILGDSSAGQGVDPTVIKRGLGGEAINFATVGNMTVANSAAMLERYLSKFGPPKRVVVVHVYDIWDRQLTGFALSITPIKPSDIALEHPWLTVDFAKRWEWELGRHAPLFSENESLIQSLRRTLKGEPVTGWSSGTIHPDGFVRAKSSNVKEIDSDLKSHHWAASHKAFSISEVNRAALRRLIELAEKHGFRLYLANSPISTRAFDNADFANYYQSVVNVVSAEFEGKNKSHYLLQEPMVFPDSQMQNLDHLTHDGAQEYTRSLVDQIKKLEGATPK